MDVNFTLPNEKKERVPSVFAAACMFVLAAAGLLAAQYIGVFLEWALGGVPGLDESFFDFAVQILYYGLFLLLPIALYARSHAGIADAMRITNIKGTTAALCCIAGVAAMLFVNYVSFPWFMLIEALGGTLPGGRVAVPTSPAELCASILMVAVLPGVAEELLFRGVLLSAWEEKGSLRALIITSVWFTALHDSIAGIPAEFICGAILAFLVISTNSLFAGIIFHTVYNASGLILSYLASGQTAETEAAESVSILSSIGGVPGLISVLFSILIFGALLFSVLRRIDRARIREERFDFGVPPSPERERSVSEWAVLCSGGAIVAAYYFLDFLSIAGIIR